MLTPIGYENTNVVNIHFYDKVEPGFDCLEDKTVRVMSQRKTSKLRSRSNKEEGEVVNVMLDFETDTSGEVHVPYVLVLIIIVQDIV